MSTTTTAPPVVPTCHRCHVALVERPHLTREAAWCGTWFDHPPGPGGLFGHTTTALTPSLDLLTHLGGAA